MEIIKVTIGKSNTGAGEGSLRNIPREHLRTILAVVMSSADVVRADETFEGRIEFLVRHLPDNLPPSVRENEYVRIANRVRDLAQRKLDRLTEPSAHRANRTVRA